MATQGAPKSLKGSVKGSTSIFLGTPINFCWIVFLIWLFLLHEPQIPKWPPGCPQNRLESGLPLQGVSKKRFDRFSFISQPLKHLQKRLMAFSNSPFRGLLEIVQKLNVWIKNSRDIYKIVKTREKSKCPKY